jgi:hypothetical protein
MNIDFICTQTIVRPSGSVVCWRRKSPSPTHVWAKMFYIFVIPANSNLDLLWTTICGRTYCILFHWFEQMPDVSGILNLNQIVCFLGSGIRAWDWRLCNLRSR